MSDERIYGVFNRRTYTIAQMWADLRRINWLRAAGVWIGHRLDRQTREAVMLAVSHAHNCRYCTFIHREWALHTGLPLSLIADLESAPDDSPSRAGDSPQDPRWLATTYAEALVRADFGTVAPLLDTAITVEFDAAHRSRIETVARVMTLFNRSTNTIDALRARIAGKPVENSRLIDEIVVSAFAVALLTPTFVALLAVRRESPRRVLDRYRRPGRS